MTLLTDRAVIAVPCQLVTLNAERRQSRYRRAEHTAQTRLMAKAHALHLPEMECIAVTAIPVQPKSTLADAANHLPSVKAAIDGLVDAGVVPADDPEHVRRITFCAPVRERPELKGEGLVLVLEEVRS